MNLKDYIATIPNYPQDGIIFRDITPLMLDGKAFHYACEEMLEYVKEKQIDLIVGPESRGFIFGCPIATKLEIGFIPVRKPNKLPRKTVSVEYDLEYGANTLQMHADAIKPGQRVLVVDDLLATGGTLKGVIELVEKLKGEVVGICTLIELKELQGRALLKGYDVHSLIEY